MSQVIVVGAGIAGLVAARRLVLGGREVMVLESSDRAGGQLARHTVGGLELDVGADSFETRGGAVAQLAGRLGLGDDIVPPAELATWLFRADGTAIPVPSASLLGIPSVPLARDVIDAIGLRAALRASLDLVLPATVGATAASLSELVRRRMGRAVLERLVAPTVRGVHSMSPDQLAPEQVSPALRAALRGEGSLSHAVASILASSTAGSQVAGIRGGMVRLVDLLLADLDRFGVAMRFGVTLDDVTPDHVRMGGEVVRGEVVVAAPGVAAGRVPGRRVTVVTLVVDQPELAAAPRDTGVVVESGTPGVGARTLTHLTVKWPWLAEQAAGLQAMRLTYEGEVGDVERAVADAGTLLGVSLTRPLDADMVTWERAVPRTHAVDGMHYVGESGSGTGLAAVIAQAESEAERLLGGSPEAEG
ncbi:MAG: FAD-dependent oxidoreductase [Pseudolysinimonas sp.]